MININDKLDIILRNRGISKICCYQDFHLYTTSSSESQYPPYLRIILKGEWILNSKEWTDGFCSKFPRYSNLDHIQYQSIMAFALFALREFEIVCTKILSDNSLEILFSNDQKLVLSRQNNSLDEDCWLIDSGNDENYPDFRIGCNSEGELFMSGIN